MDNFIEVVLPDSDDTCTVCGVEAEHNYDGEQYCEQHLQERLAREM